MNKFFLSAVTAMAAILFALSPACAQSAQKVSGTVKDASGNPIVGVTVMLKGSMTGVTSLAGGVYTIPIPKTVEKPILVFSFVGMKDLEVPVGGRTTVNVVLEQSDTVIEEIVIQTGYGVVQKRSDLTGSAFQVNSEKLAQLPAARIDNMLAGLVPGVSIEENGSAVRARYNTRIRGDASLSASNEPLWIIDGVPVYTGNKSNAVAGTSFTVSPLSFINPDDIESMTVLKDAVTTALYGADGGNGVILVTTKQGKTEKASLKASVRYGVSQIDPSTCLKMLNAAQWMAYAKECWVNSVKSNGYRTLETFPYQDNEYNSYSTTDTDWYGVYTGLGQIAQINLAASGGNKNMNNYISGSYYKENSTTIGDSQERLSLRTKSRYKFSKNLSLDLNVSGSYNTNRLFSAGSYTYKTLPIFSPYEEDGYTPRLYNYYSLNDDVYTLKKYRFYENEVPSRAYNDNNQRSFAGDGSVSITWEPIAGLTFTSQEGASYLSTNEDIYYAKTTLDGIDTNGSSRRAGVFSLTWNSVNRVNFDRSFGKHKVGALAGIEFVNKDYRMLYSTGSGFSNDQIKEVGYSNADTRVGYSSANVTRSLSYLGQFSYSYDNRYVLTFTARRQGYSSFSKYTRFGNFMAAGVSWNMQNEPWFDKSVVTTLKLKGSYGNSGNSRLDTSAAYGAYSYGEANYYGGAMGATQSEAPNPGLSWENTHITNLGVSIGLWNRISLEAEYYRNYTDNLLYDGRVSSVITDKTVTRNVGEIKNEGIEITLSTTNIDTQDFTWTTDFNASHNKNTIMKLYKGTHTGFFTFVWMEGASKDAWWLVRWAGVDPATGNPMWYDKDGNLTFSFSYDNRVIMETRSKTPDLEGGMVNTLRWKDFSLRIMANYQLGGWALCNTQIDDGYSAINYNAPVEALSHWKQPGDLSVNPRVAYKQSTLSAMNSTRNLFDKTNIQIKNISLNYTVPKKLCRMAGVSDAVVSLLADNLYVWTPGQNSTRNSYKTYMFGNGMTRTFSCEVSVSF